jgi:hypothetical protein
LVKDFATVVKSRGRNQFNIRKGGMARKKDELKIVFRFDWLDISLEILSSPLFTNKRSKGYCS